MPVRLGRFEMPKRLTKEDTTATETYAKFIAEPFETGYGHTVGNSLRRVLLSSLEGAAITSVKIDSAMHEFTTIEGVVEDVTEIVLNLKKILFKAHNREPQTLLLSVNKDGPVVAEDIQLNQNIELVNPKQHICTLDKKRKFEMELEIKVGRGFLPGDENKRPDQPLGVIAIDSLVTPSRAPVSVNAPITIVSSSRFGLMDVSVRMTRSPRLRPFCSITLMSSSVTIRTPSNSKNRSISRTTSAPRCASSST